MSPDGPESAEHWRPLHHKDICSVAGAPYRPTVSKAIPLRTTRSRRHRREWSNRRRPGTPSPSCGRRWNKRKTHGWRRPYSAFRFDDALTQTGLCGSESRRSKGEKEMLLTSRLVPCIHQRRLNSGHRGIDAVVWQLPTNSVCRPHHHRQRYFEDFNTTARFGCRRFRCG